MDSNLKLLIKFPTRGRPQKFFSVLEEYISKAKNLDRIAFLISLDSDDGLMNNPESINLLEKYKKKCRLAYFFGSSKTKMQAINSDMDKISGWDIVLLASDDMVPVIEGYDQIIRDDMSENFADTDGVLWYNDGGQNKINTLSILGKKYYERFGYIYHPEYISLWCDNEFTDVSIQLKKVYKSDVIIIEHQHPVYQKTSYDALYVRNESYYYDDQKTYEKRRSINFELPKKKLITYCVYGTKPMYLRGVIKNIELAKTIYPDWICRFYIFSEAHHIKEELQKFDNVEIVMIDKIGGNYSMLYRFLPFQEKDVERFISRDTDSRLSIREKEAVDQWMANSVDFHIMKDHPNHYTPEFPILGGMFGAKGGIIMNIWEKIEEYIKIFPDKHGMDQKFLYHVYHKFAVGNHIIHTEETFPHGRNPERDNIWFVGQPIDENDQFVGDYHKVYE